MGNADNALNPPVHTEDKSNEESKPEEESKPIEEVIIPDIQEVLISSSGDSTIGWDDQFAYSGSLGDVFKKNNSDYSYFYKNVAHIFKADDITTTNLETTFTNATVKAIKQFNFRAPPEYAKVLTLGYIEGVTIANNHSRDYLEQGFTDTKNTLKKENINYFGEGEKWITNVKGHNFGFLGYKSYSYDKAFLNSLKNDIDSLKKQNAVVIINFHWGDEGIYYPNDVQKYLAHYAIDNGADLIIGHHPHVIQGIESYKGKIIAYSLGNFSFGGNRNPKDKDAFILQTKFNFVDQKLKSYGIKVIPCSVSSVSNLNDYCPTPLEGAKKDNFFKKLNNLSKNLIFELKDDFFFIDVNN
jgi:poly-gamma-glutamate synthesis protein (capsule biosynthesis protein)